MKRLPEFQQQERALSVFNGSRQLIYSVIRELGFGNGVKKSYSLILQEEMQCDLDIGNPIQPDTTALAVIKRNASTSHPHNNNE